MTSPEPHASRDEFSIRVTDPDGTSYVLGTMMGGGRDIAAQRLRDLRADKSDQRFDLVVRTVTYTDWRSV